MNEVGPRSQEAARRLLEELDKVLGSYFTHKGGTKERDIERPQDKENVQLDLCV